MTMHPESRGNPQNLGTGGSNTPTLEQQMAVLLELTRAITEAQNLSALLTGVLSPIAQAAGWCYGEVWLPDQNNRELRSAARWHEPDPALETFAATSAGLRFTPGTGLLGRVWHTRSAEWIADLHAVDPKTLVRPERAGPAGLSAGLAIPVLIDDVVIAILAFFARSVRPENPQLQRLMTTVAAQLGTAIARLQAQESLRTQEALLRSVTQSAADAILVLDDAGRIIAWNPAAECMFGYQAGEVLGRPFTFIIPADDHTRYAQLFLWLKQERSGNLGRMIELTCIRRNGSEFPAEIALSQWRAEQGFCLTAIIRDVTERKRHEALLLRANEELEQRVIERTAELRTANSELERAAHMKDEFLANMSHELRTPLNAILTLSELMTEGVYGPLSSQQQQAMIAVIESGRHLLALINDILDLTKIESGAPVLEIQPVDLADICLASVRMIEHLALKKQLQLSYRIDPEVELVQADPRRLKQVCVNLLSNAIKFTPDGGAVGLDMFGDQERNLISISVTDTGIGIAPEDISRLFRPFVQLDSSLNRRHEGAGLGLALAARLVELHGGQLTVISHPGEGSRFVVALPWRAVLDQQPAPQAVPEPIPTAAMPEHPLVLVAEDNPLLMRILTDFLKNQGFLVCEAHNGREALESARTARPHVILMDVQMPVMDGLEAIRRIRADTDVHATPIIALTALAMTGDRERCMEAGADDYISKPVNLRQLHERLNRLWAE